MVSVTSFLAGALTGIAATALGFSWRRVPAVFNRRRPLFFGAAAAAAFALCATILYFALATRHGAAAGVASVAAPVSGKAAQSMQDAVASLEERLARGGGTDDDWELLARAYDFLGRADDARRARAHLAGAPSVAALMNAADGVAAPAQSADAGGWLGRAQQARANHDDRTAREAFERVIALNGMTAQSWADYADVLGSLAGGSLTGDAGAAIDRALALDPANAKALWLKASQAHEQRRFAEALTWWRKLRAVTPADSPDTRIIDGNIAEDAQLLKSAAVAELSGTVSIDNRLAARVQPDATLFIYAKAADAPGPPLAVLRTRAAAWPVAFRLDDSMAMVPSRRLSQFDKVVVEARVSRSGQATPGSGDLYVTSAVVNPGAAGNLALVINREID